MPSPRSLPIPSAAGLAAAGLIAVVLAATAPVRAQGAKELSAAEIAQHGAGQAVLACSTCHGQSGEGNASAGFPRLAGLPEAYLATQLNELADGPRQNAVMQPMAQALSAQQRIQLAKYYSKLPSPRSPAQPAQGTLDDRVALHGRWDEEIPACVNCHGANGSGVGREISGFGWAARAVYRKSVASLEGPHARG